MTTIYLSIRGPNESKRFTCVILTDGVGIDFICEKQVPKKSSPPTPASIKKDIDDLSEAIIWRVDPGIREMFVASDERLPDITTESYDKTNLVSENTLANRRPAQRSAKESPVQASPASKKGKWRPSNSGDLPEERGKTTIIAYGAANFGHLRGNVTAPTKHMKGSLKDRNWHAPTYLVELDEYLSSQFCALCHTRTTKHAQNAIADDIYLVLVCSSCSTHWNRDHMALLNIRSTFMYIVDYKNRRPKPFERPPKEKKGKT
ncbi:hypothetical protein K501DRAFT_303133 [Backusella circina FSU 941]|nr:hypothetical protein K501DRAFT_303133 [Backusella circina FSU 941]